MPDRDKEIDARFQDFAQLADDDASELEAFSVVVEHLRASDRTISFDRDSIWESVRVKLRQRSELPPNDLTD